MIGEEPRVATCPHGPARREPKRLGRTLPLDGLRGLAIAVVALFHYPTRRVFVGGLFGVGVFFVLSGFLITTILLDDHERYGRIRIAGFLRRRAWRLLPALVAFLVIMTALAGAYGRHGWYASNPFGLPAPGKPVTLAGILKGDLAALSYTFNFFLAHHRPVPAPYGHLWTLAVEGQFYVMWALAAAWLLRRGRGALAGATLILIAVSAVSPFLAWRHGTGQNWIYFDTLPRVQELLAGSLLAQIWYAGLLEQVPAWALRVSAAVGGGLLVWLVLRVANVPLKYLGATTIVAVAATVVVAHLIDSRSSGAARGFLSWAPIVWLGQRSYAVYLWHWPFAEWTNQLPHRVGVPLGLGCTLIAAELSWRLVEQPAVRLKELLHAPAHGTIAA